MLLSTCLGYQMFPFFFVSPLIVLELETPFWVIPNDFYPTGHVPFATEIENSISIHCHDDVVRERCLFQMLQQSSNNSSFRFLRFCFSLKISPIRLLIFLFFQEKDA